LGQLRGLVNLDGVLDAPNLRELQLVRKMNVSASDIDRLRRYPSLQKFDWFAEDVPYKDWSPVVEAVGLPSVPVLHPADWFKQRQIAM
jgi:hypothetical protein